MTDNNKNNDRQQNNNNDRQQKQQGLIQGNLTDHGQFIPWLTIQYALLNSEGTAYRSGNGSLSVRQYKVLQERERNLTHP